MLVRAIENYPKKSMAVVGTAFAGIAATAVGTAPHADASALAWCAPVPVDSRLEADCTNNDVVPATVGTWGLCTNLRTIGGEWRMLGRETIHVSSDCGPGAHPVFWSGGGSSDHEEQQREWDQLHQEQQQGYDVEQHHHHHKHHDH